MSKNIEDLLRGADPKQLEESLKKAQAFTSTAAGQKILSELKGNADLSGIKDAKSASEYMKQNPDIVNKLLAILKNN